MLYLLLWRRVSESEIVARFPDLPMMAVLNVTRYHTFRTAAASLTALARSVASTKGSTSTSGPGAFRTRITAS